MTTEPIDPALLETIRGVLPESKNVNAIFLDPSYKPTLLLSENATIKLTFVDEGAGYRNSLGWFSVSPTAYESTTNGQINTDGKPGVSLTELTSNLKTTEIGWVFPNASELYSGGQLVPGNTVEIGNGKVFAKDTAVGFFLVQDGWDGRTVAGAIGDTRSPLVMYTLDYLNPEAKSTMTGTSSSEGTSTRHVAMLFANQQKDYVIMGFEDLNRTTPKLNVNGYTSDKDFNDAVFIIKSSPVTAIQSSKIATAPGPLAGGTLGASVLAGFLGLRRRRRA
ncbi:MAG: DUF4114 domain-containing protein [Geminicoccaceae bacterium]